MLAFKHSVVHLLWLYIAVLFVDASLQELDQSSVIKAAERLIQRYSINKNTTTGGLTSHEFGQFVEAATWHSGDLIENVFGSCQRADNCTENSQCQRISEIFKNLAQDGQLTDQGIVNAIPVALNTLTSENCSDGIISERLHKRKHRRPSMAEAFGYSIGFCSIIILVSNVGACLGPMMEKRFFKRMLQFLVAMGAGSLISTSLLVLLPEAFDIIEIEELGGYVWKATAAVLSFYAFFCSERMLKICLSRKRGVKRNISLLVDDPTKNVREDPSVVPLTDIKEPEHGHSHNPENRQTLAWMIMAGDIIHKFVDGLSIGAAFTEDITMGMSLALAIICEELPHELADIAILLHSGLSIKKSLLINCFSGCFVYVGVVIGVLIGTMVAEACLWIFAMAGGLFLYVPLVVMLPDMRVHLDTLIAVELSEARIVAGLHTVGLVIGTAVIIIITNVSDYIILQ